MKKIIFSILLVLVLVFPAFATNHYILAGATGTGTGADWTNALTAPPATLVRGDTYYIADGNYSGYTFNTAVSGTALITIKKCPSSALKVDACQSVTGWSDTYGVGQAVFQYPTSITKTTINIITSYITFDGVVGSGGDINSYGFRVKYPADGGTASDLWGIGLPATGYPTTTVSNVGIYHVAVEGMGNVACLNTGNAYYCCNAGIGGNSSNMANNEIAYNYIYGWQTNLVINAGHDTTVHHNFLDSNSSGSYCHGQNMSIDGTDNISFYDNVFKNSNIFIMGAHGNIGTNTGTQMYNNISDGYQGTQLSGCFVNGGSGASDVWWGAKFYQNTFVNLNCGGYGAFFVGNLSNVTTQKSYAYNNLFYNVVNPGMNNDAPTYTAGGVVHDYNAYLKCTGTYSGNGTVTAETHGQVDASASNPLNADYTINQPADAGNAAHVINTGDAAIIAPPWNVDAAGNARPYNLTNPDIGAYEYIGGGVTQYAVTPTLAGTGCTMSLTGVTQVISGESLQLTSSCQNGFQATWSGSCGGSASAATCANNVCVTTYTTSAINGACGVTMTGGAIPILPWH